MLYRPASMRSAVPLRYASVLSFTDCWASSRVFMSECDWERFHTPKNLVMAVSGEGGELMAIFQWLNPGESEQAMADGSRAERVRHGLADVFANLLRLADVLDVELGEASTQR
jgi:dCTP diphosphatase